MACQATRRQHSALSGSPRHRPAPPPLRGADGSWRRDNGACHQAISRRFTRTAHHGCSRTTPRGPRAPGIPRPRRPFPGGGDGPARAGDPYGAGEPGAGEPGAPGAALTRARGHGPAPPAEPARAARAPATAAAGPRRTARPSPSTTGAAATRCGTPGAGRSATRKPPGSHGARAWYTTPVATASERRTSRPGACGW